jgi:pectinesterase
MSRLVTPILIISVSPDVKNFMNIIRFTLLAVALVCQSTLMSRAADATNAAPIKIILIGDSTMTDSAGWGLGFRQFLVPGKVDLINASRGGRSSMSYMKEGRWTNALALHGDYYVIQFGHNNEPGKPGRSTDMATFVANMKQYVDDARAIGAQPVLITPLVRRQWASGSDHKINSSLAPYAEEVRKIAAEKHVPLVDLHERSKELCESLGRKKCLEFSPIKTVNGTKAFDHTHLTGMGHVMFARLVVEELRRAAPALAPVLLAEPLNANPEPGDAKFDAVVSADGSGTQTNLQDAIDAAPDNGSTPFTILIKPGIYQGQFIVPPAKRHLKLIGEETENTILTGSLNQNEPSSSGGKIRYNNASVVVLGDDFQARNITFQNTSGDHGQALALRADGDREVFNHCRFLGWQDTLLVNRGRYYFTNCYVEGRVDFIYGSATAVFDHCEIHSKNGGHITAADTPKDQPFGFVFMNCRLTGDPKPWISAAGISVNTNSPPLADLGRPWRPYASVTYLNCEMGAHIRPEGWNNWRNPTNELTARYSEYHSTGPGANPTARFKWTHQLTDEEASAFTIENIFGGTDHWKPDLN